MAHVDRLSERNTAEGTIIEQMLKKGDGPFVPIAGHEGNVRYDKALISPGIGAPPGTELLAKAARGAASSIGRLLKL